MTVIVSFIPNIQRFSSMLGTSYLQHCFSKVNLSSIMAASIDSPIYSSVSSFSLAQLITTCQYDIPSVCITLPEKMDFSICDSFTSLAFTSVSCRMNIVPVSMDIPLNKKQSDPLVSIHQQSNSSSSYCRFWRICSCIFWQILLE